MLNCSSIGLAEGGNTSLPAAAHSIICHAISKTSIILTIIFFRYAGDFREKKEAREITECEFFYIRIQAKIIYYYTILNFPQGSVSGQCSCPLYTAATSWELFSVMEFHMFGDCIIHTIRWND